MALEFLNDAYFAGKVGIGTQSGVDLLAVHNTSSGTVDAQMNFTTVSTGQGSSDGFRVGWNGTVAQMYLFENADMRFATNDTERMRITAGGNVGIGTTSPAAGLQVAKGGTTIPVAGSSTASAVFGNSTSDDNYGVAIGANSSGVGYISSQRTDGTATTYNLAIQPNGGNVGIGTASPIGKLEVRSSVVRTSVNGGADELVLQNAGYSGMTILSSNTTAAQIHFGDDAMTNTGMIQYWNSTNSMTFSTNGGSERMRINSAGNVGIGLTNPADRLDLYDSDDNVGMYFHTATSGTGAGNGLRVGQNNANAFVWNYEATPLSLATGGTARLTINATGGIRFNTGYGAGTLVTDASGNITVSSGGGAGGPYLPLAGGTMTGTGAIVMPDGFKLQLGNGIFSIFNDGTYSIIRSANEPLLIDSNGITFRGYSPYNTLATITSSGISIKSALLSNQENTDVDTGAEVVAQVSTSTYTAAFFDFVIKKVGNIRSGTVYACHDGTNVEFTETSTQDLGDTSDVTLSVDKSGTNLRLIATVTSDDWIIKSLIRAI